MGGKKDVYAFYLNIANDALELYEKWTKHPGFKGSGLKNGLERDDKGNIIRVYDGLIFPIIAAHALFVEKGKNNRWHLNVEQAERIDDTLIDHAKRIFIEVAKSKAEVMGKTQSCYTQLYGLVEVMKNNPLG